MGLLRGLLYAVVAVAVVYAIGAYYMLRQRDDSHAVDSTLDAEE